MVTNALTNANKNKKQAGAELCQAQGVAQL